MPNRIIKESIRTSKTVNGLTDFQFRLWVYLITYVDDFGRGSADPELLKGFVFPRRRGVTESTIAKTLTELATIGCIDLYEVDGESYLCFPSWGEHQRIQKKRSKFPEPQQGNPPQLTVSHGESPPESNPNPNPNTNPNTNPNPNPNPRESDGKAAAPVEASVFVETYHALCGNLPKCKVLTDQRRRKVQDFQKQLSPDKWAEVCRIANANPFCTGHNDRGWKANFDFLIRPDKAANVLEGQYDNERRTHNGGTLTGETSRSDQGKTGKWQVQSDLARYLEPGGTGPGTDQVDQPDSGQSDGL